MKAGEEKRKERLQKRRSPVSPCWAKTKTKGERSSDIRSDLAESQTDRPAFLFLQK